MYPKNDPKKFPDVPGDRTPDLVNIMHTSFIMEKKVWPR
jgi:hypothetical protein